VYRKLHPEWAHSASARRAASRYRNSHREEIAEYGRRYREEHPDERAAHSRTRHARKNNAPGKHTAADVAAQYARQRGRCFWCRAKVGDDYHVDHVIPLVLGGSNGPENIVVTCKHCNLSKRGQHPMDFAGVML
jgi:5-methylcytosine-specific restriction endonuclease McrA